MQVIRYKKIIISNTEYISHNECVYAYWAHIGFDDAEGELKRMEEFRNAQAEVEQKMFKVI